VAPAILPALILWLREVSVHSKHMASARKKSNSRSQSIVGKRKDSVDRERHYVICIRNDDYSASLELKKLYEVLEDEFGAEHQMIRVIDESGEATSTLSRISFESICRRR
jgi:hypothetical protein